MKYIKSYDEFIKLEEGKFTDYVKKIALGTALTTTTLNNNLFANDSDTLKFKTNSKEVMNRKIKYDGYILDDIKIDTIYNIVRKVAPEETVYKMDSVYKIDGDVFLTGQANLNPDVKNNILYNIGRISEDYIITEIVIESSTDKEPIKGGNLKLSSKRSDVVLNEILNLGFDTSLISIINKPDQGPDIYNINMTKEQRIEARQKTKQYRYVKISIIYMNDDVIKLPEVLDTIIDIKNTYYLIKEVIKQKTKTPKNIHNHFNKTTKKLPIIKTKRKNKKMDCFDFDNKGFWNDKNLGYQ